MKKAQISFISAISIVLGCVVGSGVFMKPARVLEAAGSTNGALLAWALGGIIALFGALTLAEIAARIPKIGGIYTYSEEIFGKAFGFTSGWIQTIIYGPALSAGVGLYFSSLFVQLLEFHDSYVKPVAIFAIIILCLLICMKTSWGIFMQNATNLGKFVPFIAVIFGGLLLGNHDAFNVVIENREVASTGMGAAILATFWAYDGWSQVSSLGDEIKDPARNLPRVFIYGILIIISLYLVVNWAILKSAPAQDIVGLHERAVAVVAENLFGHVGGMIVSVGILISIFGVINANIITIPVITYSMAKDKLFPASKFIGKTSKTNTPANSILFHGLVSVIMVLFFNVDRITDIAMFSMYVFYSVIFIGLFKLRKQDKEKNVKGVYRVPLYPLVPLLAITGSLYVCYSMLENNPYDALGAILVAVLGFPVYFYITRKKD